MFSIALGSSSDTRSFTGNKASSPGANSCCSKQKHSNFLRCAAAFDGATLGTAWAVIFLSVVFFT